MVSPVNLDFAIIGAQKSGSTSLQAGLVRHPSVEMPREEVRAFEDPHFGRGGPERVEQMFTRPRAEVRRGIRRPDYLADPAVPARLAAAVPGLRLMVLLRDPVERAVSAYFHYVRLGFLPPTAFGEGFSQVLEGRLQQRFPRAADVVGYGFYGQQLTRYLEHFPREQLCVLLQGDLKVDPTQVLGSALAHIGLQPGPERPATTGRVEQDRRANRGTYDARRVRLQRSRNRFMFDYDDDGYRRTPKRMSASGLVYVAAASLLDRQVLGRLDHTPAPVLSAETVAVLRGLYAEDTATVEAIVGRQQIWGQPPR